MEVIAEQVFLVQLTSNLWKRQITAWCLEVIGTDQAFQRVLLFKQLIKLLMTLEVLHIII